MQATPLYPLRQVSLVGDLSEEVPPTCSSDTTVASMVAIHQRLEARRQAAASTGSYGPRVMVAGPTDVGKSTMVRTLATYAARLGWAPTLVDLDVGQGDTLAPGCIAASPVDIRCVDPAADGGWQGRTPLVYFPGSTNPDAVMPVWEHHTCQLARGVNARMVSDATARASGLFINTAGWVEGKGYGMLLHAAKAFNADVVLVLGQETLVTRLKSAKGLADIQLPPLPTPAADPVAAKTGGALTSSSTASAPSAAAGGAQAGAGADATETDAAEVEEGAWSAQPALPPRPHTTAIVYVKRSAGVVPRSRVVRQQSRNERVRQYFYGAQGDLMPTAHTLLLEEVHVVSVGGGVLDALLLPVGKESLLHPLRVTELSDSELEDLVHQVLAVSFASKQDAVPHVNVAGFVHVLGVDVAKGTMRVMSPNSKKLPGKFLICGSVKWVP